MKMNSTTIGWIIGAFVWCIFMGVTAISIGFGALYPPLNYIAKPLVCPNGELSVEQNVSHPTPGRTDTTAMWFCRNPGADTSTPIDPLKMGLYAGPFYGVLLFLVGFFFFYGNIRWSAETIIGKVFRRVQAAIGILLLAFVILFPMWPLISAFLPGPTPTPMPSPTKIPTVPTLDVPAVVAPTLLQPATDHPTLASIEQSKAIYSSNGPSIEALAREQYLPADFAKPGTLSYTVPLASAGQQVLWQYGWCATTSAILAADLKSIQLQFVLDGEPVPLDDFAVDDSPAKNGEQCRTFYLALGPWPVGTHDLTTTATFTGAVNDGNSDYAPGDYVLDYVVIIQ